MARPEVLTVGSRGVSLLGTIKTDENRLVDLSSASVAFSMRPALNASLKINHAAAVIISATAGEVRYDWAAIDVDTEGTFSYWWTITPAVGQVFDTDEEALIFTAHSPGLGATTGVIVDGAANFMPVTFARLRDSEDFSAGRLQHYSSMAQAKAFGTYVGAAAEAGTYDFFVVDYLSKVVARDLCTPGIDYWGRQLKTSTTQNPTEIESYPDMIKALEDLRVRLDAEIADDLRNLPILSPATVVRNIAALPISSLDDPARPWDNHPITRDPYTTRPLLTGGGCW